jgi:hypothetical protein
LLDWDLKQAVIVEFIRFSNISGRNWHPRKEVVTSIYDGTLRDDKARLLLVDIYMLCGNMDDLEEYGVSALIDGVRDRWLDKSREGKDLDPSDYC